MKKVSIKDVARLSKVSIAAVSKIINGKNERFPQKTIDRVLKARDDLGYVANYAAKTLKEGMSSILIGVIVPSFRVTFFADLLQSIAINSPKNVNLVFFAARDEELENAIYTLIERGVSAFIFGRQVPSHMIINNLLKKQNIPYLVLDQNGDKKAQDSIIVNEFQGGGLVAKHFVELGHEKIAILSPTMLSHNMQERQEGFLAILKQNNIRPVKITTAQLSRNGGFQVSKEIIDSKVTAVFVLNDDMAMGLIRGLFNFGVSVPKDISIAGYDDNDYAAFFIPTLTTVKQPSFDIGKYALELIVNRLTFPYMPKQVKKFNLKLVQRESTIKNISV